MFTRSDLRPEQRAIHRFIMENDTKLIVSGMGSGKTAATLTAIRDLMDGFEVRHVLVVAPLLVAQETWPQEIRRWEHTRPLTYAVAADKNRNRAAAAIAQRADITIINFESLQWLAKHLGSTDNWYWDCVIVDEISRFKAGEARTKRAKVKDPKTGKRRIRKGGNMTRFGVIATARKKIDRIYGLTGTPFGSGVKDAWGQVYALDQGKRLGETREFFERRWFFKNSYTREMKPRPGAEDEIMAKISDIMVTIPERKLVDTPDYIPFYVNLSPKVMSEYNRFRRTLYSEEHDVEAVTRGVLANKLLQFANGSMYREDGSLAHVHSEKIAALKELREQSRGENLLVFYGYKFDRDQIKKAFPEAVVANESDDAIRRWNAGKISMLIAHPASIGHGLNLQYGGHIAIWYGLTFWLEIYQQACMRLPRPGQTKQVKIYHIIARGTYDEIAMQSLCEDAATQQRLSQQVLTHIYQ